MTEGVQAERRSGQDRRKSNWRDATERRAADVKRPVSPDKQLAAEYADSEYVQGRRDMRRDFEAALAALEAELRETQDLDEARVEERHYWADRIAALWREHQS